MRIFHVWQFFINLFKYYLWDWKFFLVDFTILLLYFFRTPFRHVRIYDESHPDHPIGPYGETDFSTCDKILREFGISKDLSIADMGCGRGRLCFWLRLVRGHRSVLGVEQLPLFIERAQKVQRWFHVSNLTFLNQDWNEVSLTGIDVIYFYGSALEEDTIVALGTKLLHLPPGTKIITTTYWFGEFFPDAFQLEKKTRARFIWGKADVYLQTIR